MTATKPAAAVTGATETETAKQGAAKAIVRALKADAESRIANVMRNVSQNLALAASYTKAAEDSAKQIADIEAKLATDVATYENM